MLVRNLFKQIQRNKPDLLDATFSETLEVLPHTDSTRMIIERWFQVNIAKQYSSWHANV